MCCFEHSYSGIFQDRANRRASFIGVGVVEVLDKSFHAGIAAVELSPIIKAYLVPRVVTIITLTVLYLSLGSLHFAVFRNCKSPCLQLGLSVLVRATLALLLLALLSMTEVEGWSTVGLVSLTLITVVIIKLFGIAVAYFDLVDMSGDWSYLIEFSCGFILIVIVVGIELLVITHSMLSAAIVAAALGTLFSLISLLDLHQNMNVNYWWWEENMLDGCVHHVSRQYTLLWCLRIENKPQVTTIFGGASQQRTNDTMC